MGLMTRTDRHGKTVYYIDYYIKDPKTGKRKRKRERVGYRKKEAEQAIQSRQTDIRRAKFDGILPEPTCTLEDIKDDYLRRHLSSKSEGTRIRNKDIIEDHLIPAFGRTSLNQIMPEMVEEYRAGRLREPKAHATINKEVQVLKHVVKKAAEWGKVRTNVIADVKPLKVQNDRVQYLDHEQVPRVLEQCQKQLDGKLWHIVMIGMFTGMRRGEILSLQCRQIDKKNRLLRVDKTKNGNRKDIPMSDELFGVIQGLPRQVDTPYLFAEEDGGPLNGPKVSMAFKRACKKAGIEDFTLHDLRHHFGSWLSMKGHSTRTVQELLGHKTPAMTARYSHLSDQHLTEAVHSLDGLFDVKVESR